MAGPWSVEPVPGRGFGVFRAGEHPSRGFRPVARLPRPLPRPARRRRPARHRARAAALPRRRPGPGRQGYAVRLDDGTVVGHLAQFDEPLIDAVNAFVGVVRLPASLAFVLEAAGSVALERCGAILEERVVAVSSEAGL